MDFKQQLAWLLWKNGCVMVSDKADAFTLASGRKSDFYINCRKLFCMEDGISTIANHLASQIHTDWPPVHRLGAAGFGGASLLAALQMASAAAVPPWSWPAGPWKTFFVRDRAKEHGLSNKFEGFLEAGHDCVLVDDVLTTGGTLIDTIKLVRENKADVVCVYVLVDRQEGGREALLEQRVPVNALLTREELLQYRPPSLS